MKRTAVPPNKRRRFRGGGPSTTRNATSGVIEIPDDDPSEIDQLYLYVFPSLNGRAAEFHPGEIEDIDSSEELPECDDCDYFELYENDNLLLVLPYDGDMDDRVLEEMRPRYVVMYEPNAAFIRRVEVPTLRAVLTKGIQSISPRSVSKSPLFVLQRLR